MDRRAKLGIGIALLAGIGYLLWSKPEPPPVAESQPEVAEPAEPPEPEEPRSEWIQMTTLVQPPSSTHDPGAKIKDLGKQDTRLGKLSVFQSRASEEKWEWPDPDGVYWLKVGTTQWPLTEITADFIELKTATDALDGGVNALAFGCSGVGCNFTSVVSFYVDPSGKQLTYSVMDRAYRYPEYFTLRRSTGEIIVGFSNWEEGSQKRSYILDHGDIRSELNTAEIDDYDVNYCEFLYEALAECEDEQPACEIDVRQMRTLSPFTLSTLRVMGSRGDAPYLDQSAYVNACLDTCRAQRRPTRRQFFGNICTALRELRGASAD